jgi:hypothetical protein
MQHNMVIEYKKYIKSKVVEKINSIVTFFFCYKWLSLVGITFQLLAKKPQPRGI